MKSLKYLSFGTAAVIIIMMAAATVTLGYLGCLLVGLPFGAKFVKELRHAGIIREV